MILFLKSQAVRVDRRTSNDIGRRRDRATPRTSVSARPVLTERNLGWRKTVDQSAEWAKALDQIQIAEREALKEEKAFAPAPHGRH